MPQQVQGPCDTIALRARAAHACGDGARSRHRRVIVSGMTDLAGFRGLVGRDHGLCVVSTLRADDTIHSSVVNAGVLDHPITGAPVIGLVAVGGSRKLAHLRARPRATIVVRAGWEWTAVEGPVTWPAQTTHCRASTPTPPAYYYGPCSPPPAEHTKTGTPTTASWPTNAAPPCSSPRTDLPKPVRPDPLETRDPRSAVDIQVKPSTPTHTINLRTSNARPKPSSRHVSTLPYRRTWIRRCYCYGCSGVGSAIDDRGQRSRFASHSAITL